MYVYICACLSELVRPPSLPTYSLSSPSQVISSSSRPRTTYLGDLHIDGTTTLHDVRTLHGTTHNHDSVVERPLRLVDELLGATTQHQGRRLGLWAPHEKVVPLVPDLSLLEGRARTQGDLVQRVHCRLNARPRGLRDTLKIIRRDPNRAEDTPVRKVLGAEVANGEAREHNLGPGGHAELQLLEDNLPLRVHYRLEEGLSRRGDSSGD